MATRKVERPDSRVNQGVVYPEDFSLFKETVKGIPQAFSEVVGQPSLRAYAGLSSAITGKTLTPSTQFQRDLYGTDQPLTAERSGRELVGEKAPTALAAPVGFVLGAADLFGGSGTAGVKFFKNIKNFRNAGKAASKLEDAVKVLRSGGVSDQTINTLKLGDRLVTATDDPSVERIFREAAQAEDAFKRTGKISPPRTVTRQNVPETPAIRNAQNVEIPTTATRATPEPSQIRRSIQKDALNQADEARFIRDEVLPTPTKLDGTPAASPTRFTQPLEDYIFYERRERLTPEIQNEIDALNIKPEQPITLWREGTIDPSNFQSWTKNPDFFQNPVSKTFRPEEILVDTTDSRFRSLFPQSSQDALTKYNNLENEVIVKPQQTLPPDQIIERAAQKYEAVENIGLGTSAMSRLAQRAPSLGGMDLASDLLTPISSRLGRINPKLKFKVRNLEIETRRLTTERLNAVLPLMNATKKMSPIDKTTFDLALKNGDSETITAFANKYGIQNELDSARKMLDDVFKEAEGVGLDVSYRGDFFPRQVKNPEAFSQYLRGREDWGGIRKQIEEKAQLDGKKFTDLTNEEIAGITNNILRGYGSQVTLAGPGQIKARTIEELGTELNRFYENSNTALLTYVHKMTDEIEGRKFFGKAAGEEVVTKNPLTGEKAVFNTEDSIGSYVTKLMADGDITPKQQDEVTKILQARFKKGGMNGIVSAYRDLEYISTMGNPISAITQLGDLAFALYKNGWWNTARGVGKTVTRRTELTKEKLGIERIAQEFDNPSKTSKVLERVFKMVGMEQIDRLGKETFLESSRLKLKNLANKGDEGLITDLNYMFDTDDAIRALEELKAGDVTTRTKEVIMNRLMDFQPIAKSEMPVKYLEMPNGRILYMLKSFTIKQFDVFRREAIDQIISGSAVQKAAGLRKLIYLSGTFMLANATADEIKDFVLGRETPPSDRLVDNIFRLFGASKYDVYNSRERGVGFAVLQRLLPPASVIDRLSTDISRIAEDKRYKTGPLEGERYGSEAVQSIPGGGKLYYWWLGRGDQKEEYSNDATSAATNNSRVRSITRPGQDGDQSNSRARVIERP